MTDEPLCAFCDDHAPVDDVVFIVTGLLICASCWTAHEGRVRDSMAVLEEHCWFDWDGGAS